MPRGRFCASREASTRAIIPRYEVARKSGVQRMRPGAARDRRRRRRYQERDFLSRIRRLTVEGKRAGEGYWSPDGKRLVFQSEREPGNPFYQIYTLDLATGDDHAHLARHRQDDVRVLPAGAWRPGSASRSSSPRRTPIRSRSSTRTKSSPFARRARSAATRGTTTPRWTSTRTTRRPARPDG